MHLSTTLLALTISFLTSSITASAIPATSPARPLSKRGPQVLYLTDCFRLNQDLYHVEDSYWCSHGAWYYDTNASQHGEWPTSLSNEYRDWAHGGGALNWEQVQNLYFSDSGVTVTTRINSGSISTGVGTQVGVAWRNSDGYQFTCYRDDRELFRMSAADVGDGSNRDLVCNAIYYCM